MPITKPKGNMYPWVTGLWTPVRGRCPHKCKYCYVDALRKFPEVAAKYEGPVTFDPSESNTRMGQGRTIFVGHMTDLFAAKVPVKVIHEVLSLCLTAPKNVYVFQTKNPGRIAQEFMEMLPTGSMVGTTVETNRVYAEFMGETPTPFERISAMAKIRKARQDIQTFITVEPIMDFDLQLLVNFLVVAKPTFVNIGADSKKSNLPEPNRKQILDLLAGLKKAGIAIREKPNLGRLLG